MTDSCKRALEEALQFRFSANVSEQICSGDSSHTAQPLGADGVQQNKREHAACYRFIGVNLSEESDDRIYPPFSTAVAYYEEERHADGDEQHLDHKRMSRRKRDVLLQKGSELWRNAESCALRIAGCGEKGENEQTHDVVNNGRAENH